MLADELLQQDLILVQIQYKNEAIKTKAKSNLFRRLSKSLKPGMFADQVTAQTNKFHGMRIGRSTAPGPSNTPDQITWRAKYAACVVDWNALTPEQKAAYQEDADKRKITAFNQFMSLCLLEVPPEYEDFTDPSYVETDPLGYLTVTANKIAVDTPDSSLEYGVAKDFSVDHFGDFEHLFEFYVNSIELDCMIMIYIVTNQNIVHLSGCITANDALCLMIRRSAADNYELKIACYSVDDSDTFAQFSIGTLYFAKFKRAGATLTCDIYTGSHGGSLVTSLSCNCEIGAKRYLVPCGSFGGAATWDAGGVGYLQNLKLG